ncbi:MAG: xylulokinase [Defluviitaleaceae bacterium]|nr:xylulokinase [Defluviitaleaceae bacterium]
MNQIIGLDIGTNSVKAIILQDGKVLGQTSVGYSPDYLGDGKVEQDPAIWWDATQKAIRDITAAHPGHVVAISAAGQMHSSVFLDENGNVIRNAILWNDMRTTKQVNDIYNAAGSDVDLVETAHNYAFEGFTLPKILWLRENEEVNFNKVSKVIMPKDYINYKLTGRVATDVSDAAGTLLLDIPNRKWNTEFLAKVGLSSDLLPDVLESVDAVGKVQPELAAELGLSPETLVIAGGADNSCAAIGNGVTRAGQTVISIGTSGTIVTMFDKMPEPSVITGEVHLFNYSYPEKFYAMGCMLCAGESLNWLRTILNIEDFNDFNVLAEQSSAGAGGVIFLPYLFGERCPYPDPYAKSIFFGMSTTTTRADMVRAVMEGVAYNVRVMYDMVTVFTPITDIYITGGGAKSDIWGRIIASALGREITVLNIEEGPAFGAALIAGVGAGIFADFDTAKAQFLQTAKVIQPENNPIYAQQFEKFEELYCSNSHMW